MNLGYNLAAQLKSCPVSVLFSHLKGYFMRTKWLNWFTKQRLILLGGDWLTLTIFVLWGQIEHGLLSNTDFLPRLLTTTAVMIFPWTVIGWLWGAYQLEEGLGWRLFLGRALTTWLISAPLMLVLRAFLRGQAVIMVIFVLIALGLGGVMMLGWRLVYYRWWLRVSRDEVIAGVSV